MGLKLTVQRRSSIARPFLVPLKWGTHSRKQRAAMFFSRWPFWNRWSAVLKLSLCDSRFPEQGTDHRKGKFPHREHCKAIAFAITKNVSQSDFIAKRSNRYARHHCTQVTIAWPTFVSRLSVYCQNADGKENKQAWVYLRVKPMTHPSVFLVTQI